MTHLGEVIILPVGHISWTGWWDDYKRKLVSAEEAVKVVNSDDRVVFPLVNGCHTLGASLAARKGGTTPTQADVGMFYELGMQESFRCTIELFYPRV